MITIYHNTRCSKSREGLDILEKSGKDFRIREYIKLPLTPQELKFLVDKLGLTPLQVVRKNEKLWKENYEGRDLSDNEILHIMAEHPQLIERPIIETENLAVIGRPPSRISEII